MGRGSRSRRRVPQEREGGGMRRKPPITLQDSPALLPHPPSNIKRILQYPMEWSARGAPRRDTRDDEDDKDDKDDKEEKSGR